MKFVPAESAFARPGPLNVMTVASISRPTNITAEPVAPSVLQIILVPMESAFARPGPPNAMAAASISNQTDITAAVVEGGAIPVKFAQTANASA